MKIKLLIAPLIVIIVSFFAFIPSFAATPPSEISNSIEPSKTLYQKIATLKVKDVKKILGRRLTLKERISFMFLKHKAKKKAEENTSKGKTALVFGLVGAGLFIAGLFIPYVLLGSIVASATAIITGSVAYKADKTDKKAHAGKLLGWITLGLTALLFILAIALLASIF